MINIVWRRNDEDTAWETEPIYLVANGTARTRWVDDEYVIGRVWDVPANDPVWEMDYFPTGITSPPHERFLNGVTGSLSEAVAQVVRLAGCAALFAASPQRYSNPAEA